VLERGYADLVAFGRPFIANPDLPAHLASIPPRSLAAKITATPTQQAA
jgi:2,4-dienoyl-CoA reductase-like NADH-dependent reductase (Old Yellow Enzyme family)